VKEFKFLYQVCTWSVHIYHADVRVCYGKSVTPVSLLLPVQSSVCGYIQKNIATPTWNVSNIWTPNQRCHNRFACFNLSECNKSFASLVQCTRDGRGSLCFSFCTYYCGLAFLFSLKIVRSVTVRSNNEVVKITFSTINFARSASEQITSRHAPIRLIILNYLAEQFALLQQLA
jgi:hypothetical protein